MKKLIPLAAILLAALIAVVVWQVTSSSTGPSAQPAATASAPAVLPVATNPIHNPSTNPGLSITDAIAENNVDPQTKAPVGDRLQFTIHNSSQQPLSSLQVYYTMKDKSTGKTESYFQQLTGLTLAPHSSQTVYFDNGTGPGHYPENKYSLYRSSTNQVDFSIEASASGLAPATATAVKSPGSGEKLD